VAIGASTLGESSMTTPAFMDGHIYIRGKKSLFCIGEKIKNEKLRMKNEI